VSDEDDARPELHPERVRRVRLGHGANCSSIGSVVDTLFATATVGAAVFAAMVAALAREPVRLAPQPPQPAPGTGPRANPRRADPAP
jgi:hypothetical protein